MISTAHEKLSSMQHIIRDMRRVAVAFSGGVDSAFVLKVAAETLGSEQVLAITSCSASVPRAELEQARKLADDLGVRHVFIETDEFSNEDYLSNPVNRCYFCKTTLYTAMMPVMREHGIENMVNGTNSDDLGDYRPGLQAAREHGVRAPAAEAQLTKNEIRELSREFGLPTHDKPAAPCLSSRVPYGERITPEKLRMIEAGEAVLGEIGIRECRVRCHDTLARIEVATSSFPVLFDPDNAALIDRRFREFGFDNVTVDLKGFRSGSLNEVIAFGTRQS